MTDLTKLMFAACLFTGLTLVGCSGGEDNEHADAHAEVDGHEGHDHDEAGGDEHDTGDTTREVTVGDTVLEVSVGGEIEPNAVLHIDLTHARGPAPVAIRVWVGNETAQGSVKGLAVGGSGGYHADAQCPGSITPDTKLWIEVETEAGERAVAAVSTSG